MATPMVAAEASMRLAPSLAFPSSASSHASTSGSTGPSAWNCCRGGPQIASLSLLCSPAASPSTSVAAAVAFSSSRSFAPLRSAFRIPKDARSTSVVGRRNAAGAPGCSSGVRCQSQNGAEDKTPFGYTRKDVILIGAGLLVFGIGLKFGLEFFGVDSIKAGNAVQLIMVLGLTVGWISTYIFRVSSKDMTYAKQLRDYENKVIEKRLEEMPEAELESMLAQIEEEKRVIRENRDKLR